MPTESIPAYYTMLDDTPLGCVALVVDADGKLVRISHGATIEEAYAEAEREPRLRMQNDAIPPLATKALKTACAQIADFFAGTRADLSLPYRFIRGTSTQQSVWEELRRIPAGETISYGDMAARVGNPKAARAAGSACGANPLPLLCPCHRVVGSNGALGGFGWGLHAKRWLLANDDRNIKQAA